MWFSIDGKVLPVKRNFAKVRYISGSNVADFAVSAVTQEYAERHNLLELGGPHSLSQRDGVRIFEQILSNSSDPLQKTFSALMPAYAQGDVVKDAAAMAQEHDVNLRSVAEYENSFRAKGASSSVLKALPAKCLRHVSFAS